MAPTKEEVIKEELIAEGKEGTPAEVEVEKPAEETAEEAEGPREIEGLSESELGEAKRLYAALRDPRQAAPLVAALAQQAGLHLAAAPTPKELKSEAKSIQEIVKSSLGTEYQFLADRLGAAIEGALQEHSKAQDSRFAELQQSQIETQVERAYERLARESKGESKKLETRMSQLADEMPIGKQSIDSYVKRLYNVASSETAATSAKQTADKIRRNASDAPARLAQRGSSQTPEAPKGPEKMMSLNESIEFAYQQALQPKK